MLLVDSVHFDYEGKPILEGLSFFVDSGEIIALIGVSGSGKTTLFRLIAGLISPAQGNIVIQGSSGLRATQFLTYMRQEDLLLPWRTVMDNLLLFSELGKKRGKGPTLIERAHHLLNKVGLADYQNKYPKELSGGMRQRVALARALLQNRPLLLLDEPFASLDVIMREQLYALLREIRDQYKKTMVMVTHDFRDAVALADRILVLAEGKIVRSYPIIGKERGQPLEELIRSIRNDLLLEKT